MFHVLVKNSAGHWIAINGHLKLMLCLIVDALPIEKPPPQQFLQTRLRRTLPTRRQTAFVLKVLGSMP